MESMVAQHERDGRAWKAEWVALPEVCLLSGTAVHLAARLADGLEVDSARMATNLADLLTGTQFPTDPGAAPEMTDYVLDRARRRRAEESPTWP